MKTEIEDTELFGNLAERFRCSLAESLFDSLEKSDLSIEQREEIVGNFLGDLSISLDQGELSYQNKFYRPLLGFLDSQNLQFWDKNTQLILPSEEYDHHGNVWPEVQQISENIKST